MAEIGAKFHDDHFALLVVDSITALFRVSKNETRFMFVFIVVVQVDYSGRGELSVRQQNLGRLMNSLTKIAEEYNVCVLITNQVMRYEMARCCQCESGAHAAVGTSDPSGGMSFVVDPKKPSELLDFGILLKEFLTRFCTQSAVTSLLMRAPHVSRCAKDAGTLRDPSHNVHLQSQVSTLQHCSFSIGLL